VPSNHARLLYTLQCLTYEYVFVVMSSVHTSPFSLSLSFFLSSSLFTHTYRLPSSHPTLLYTRPCSLHIFCSRRFTSGRLCRGTRGKIWCTTCHTPRMNHHIPQTSRLPKRMSHVTHKSDVELCCGTLGWLRLVGSLKL